jgi:hypothetical protein
MAGSSRWLIGADNADSSYRGSPGTTLNPDHYQTGREEARTEVGMGRSHHPAVSRLSGEQRREQLAAVTRPIIVASVSRWSR